MEEEFFREVRRKMEEDDAYEAWREDCHADLENALQKFVEGYPKPGDKSYFSNRPDRIWKSIASIAQNKITFDRGSKYD